MTVPATPITADDQDFYPLHHEDDVPEIPDHELQNSDLRATLRAHFPDWFITGNVCVYWEKGNRNRYVAPDLFAVRDWKPSEKLRTYWLWQHPPIVFIAEILSAYDFKPRQEGMEAEYAAHIRAPEYLSFHLERKELKLRRLGPRGYEEVTPEANGRVRSRELDLEFGMDESAFLRIYTLDGTKLANPEELKLQLADQEERREAAEARAAEEARGRQAAEARADDEARQRAELERQLVELQGRLQERGE